MMRLLLAMLCFVGSAGTLPAQPLYVGEQEIDTADREALAAIVQHCEDLTDAQATGEAPNAPAAPVAGDTPSTPDPNSFSGPLALDALVSSDDSAEAAGEGSGSGVPASDEDDDQQGSAPVLEEITLDLCKEAGILY